MMGSRFVFFVYLPLLVVSLAIWANATSSKLQQPHSHQKRFEDGEPSDKHAEETDASGDEYDYKDYEEISDEELEEARRKFIESWEGYDIEGMGPDDSPHSDDQSADDVANHGHDLDTSSMEGTKKEAESHN
ncbi:unnamed protein product [Taenia asiatica]|uniref:Secreted phosphoprotein 1 n=1 Tax=Taenia asiatica TaxID=60517 RepID=A0A0R3VYC0_TAEAS|nr:unnamed protein product [Taenia asiatica]